MPYIETKIEKIYSIGEVAKIIGESVPNLRYWSNALEDDGTISSMRNAKGDRSYSARDLETLKIMYHLIRERKFTLEGAKQKICDNRESEIHNLEIIRKLERIKTLLLNVKKNME